MSWSHESSGDGVTGCCLIRADEPASEAFEPRQMRLSINGIYGIIIITKVAASDRLVSLLKTVHRNF